MRRRRGGAEARPALAIAAVAIAVLLPAATRAAAAAAAAQPAALEPWPLQRSRDPAEARRRARPLFPGWNINGSNNTRNTSPAAVSPAGIVVPTSVCGDNSLTPSDDRSFCQIVSTWYTATTRKPVYFYCSAFVIGRKHLGTAGHCVYSPKNATAAPSSGDGTDPPEPLATRYPATIDVYCAGADGKCVAEESNTYGTRALTTRRHTRATGPNAWDVAVVAVNDDLVAATGKAAVGIAQVTRTTRPFQARLVGYPFQNDESEACNTPEYADGCAQYESAEGTVDPSLSQPGILKGLYTSPSLDLCQGHSGSAVLDASSNKAVAVVSGYVLGGCLNLFAPLVSAANADRATCERARGGVSIDCLRRALGRRGTTLTGP
jgi:hypothetical protein